MTVIQSVTQTEDKSNKIDDTERMKKAALGYAKLLNWHVFPVHSIRNGKCTCGKPNCNSPGKHPATINGLKDATADPQTVNLLWNDFEGANIGIRTGKESGIFVLDVDVHKVDGRATLEELTAIHGPLPETVQAITGSGGDHYIFRYREGVGNKTNFAPGLDIRGDNGYIVAAPSLHASGKRYDWELSSHPLEVGIAEAPQWLIDMVTQPVYTHTDKPKPKPSSYWQKLMQGLSEGEGRNPAAASIVGHLLAKNVDLALICEMMYLWDERNNPPLGPEELNRTIKSVTKKHFEGRGKRW
ncbi:bifunctional DNA primase/polymerase [Sporosarcina luteola]|uniref:bifunctional DNA primase/polymerase n=1 Tax=Sporosarcina luteola TaxID=582850 RepID=UPI002041EB3C|nr:bifunctional DNA primase/polymerase [Sporosarcina luteola]MCM3637736.1 bifunctional DNA primase/polymerase [Sporosarcina luteola]